jgi:hypothetical protein
MRPRRCLTPLALAVALAPAACTTASASPGPDQQIYGGTAWTTLFPHAKLGFGEVGTNRGDRTACKLATLNRYYRLRLATSAAISGGTTPRTWCLIRTTSCGAPFLLS